MSEIGTYGPMRVLLFSATILKNDSWEKMGRSPSSDYARVTLWRICITSLARVLASYNSPKDPRVYSNFL